MKRVGNLYDPMISDGNLERAIHDVNASHRWLPRHKPNKTVAWVEEDIPARVKELREIIIGIIDGTVNLAPPLKKRRYDKSAGKWRDINEPLLWPDQYVHHALVQVLQPAMMKGMDRYCCGSIEKRGIHYGVKTIKKWMGISSILCMTAAFTLSRITPSRQSSPASSTNSGRPPWRP